MGSQSARTSPFAPGTMVQLKAGSTLFEYAEWDEWEPQHNLRNGIHHAVYSILATVIHHDGVWPDRLACFIVLTDDGTLGWAYHDALRVVK